MCVTPPIGERDADRPATRDRARRSRRALRPGRASGCAHVSTRTARPSSVKRLSIVPVQRSSRCSTSVRSDARAGEPSARRSTKPTRREREAMRVLPQPVAAPDRSARSAYGTSPAVRVVRGQRILQLESRRIRERCAIPTRPASPAGARCTRSGKVCSPVASAVKAKPPLPTLSAQNDSKMRTTGECRARRARRSTVVRTAGRRVRRSSVRGAASSVRRARCRRRS